MLPVAVAGRATHDSGMARIGPFIALGDWQARGASYRHRGHEIFYLAQGSGEALVLIHGFPTASWDWHKQWPALTGRYRCVAPDMIGFGFSAKPRRYDYRIGDQADLHEGLLAELDIDRYHILAHDYGDSVAQELLARDLDRRGRGETGRIASVCLLNGGLFPETHRARPVQKMLLGPFGWLVSRLISERAFGHNMRQVFGPDTPPSEAELAVFWELAVRNGGIGIYHKLIRYIHDRRANRDRWVGALRDAGVPLRLVDGVHDPVSGGHMVARYRELVPEPDVVELDCGHYPQIEAPGETLDAVLAFLERTR